MVIPMKFVSPGCPLVTRRLVTLLYMSTPEGESVGVRMVVAVVRLFVAFNRSNIPISQ